ncbi:hypothetical protein JW758_02525 [Candidatus Peregrinibacteria bacterium]|nr:hypothetical protein [Candidatus Peregrinibacteria bacterium]
MIIYISIFAVVLFIIVQLFWQVQLSEIKGGVSREVKENSSQVIDIIKRNIRNVDEVNVNDSLFGISPGVLVLSDNGGQITIDTYTKNVPVGSEYINIRKLRLAESGYSTTDITSDKVNVTNFELSNLTQSGTSTVLIDLTISSLNNTDDLVYDDEISIRTSVTTRKEI